MRHVIERQLEEKSRKSQKNLQPTLYNLIVYHEDSEIFVGAERLEAASVDQST